MDSSMSYSANAAIYFPRDQHSAHIWHASDFPDDARLLGDLIIVSAFLIRQTRNFGPPNQPTHPTQRLLDGLAVPVTAGAVLGLREPQVVKRRFELQTRTSMDPFGSTFAINHAKGFGLFKDTVVTYAPIASQFLFHFILDRWSDYVNVRAMKMSLMASLVQASHMRIATLDEPGAIFGIARQALDKR